MSKHTKNKADEKLMMIALASVHNSGLMKNKKGMLANIISGIIVLMVGFSLMGPIAQELNNAMYCGGSNSSIVIGEPLGETDSFGGGGTSHFGGYDGTVKHNKFIDAVASTSFVKTNESILNPECEEIIPGTYKYIVIKIIPGFFAIGMLLSVIGIVYTALKRGGLIEEDGIGEF